MARCCQTNFWLLHGRREERNLGFEKRKDAVTCCIHDSFPAIDSLKATLDQHRPLDPVIVRNLREDLIVRWTYHSNAIEGNTLTLQETKVALEGITIGGKSLREHLEAVNHRNAILLLEELVQRNEPLTEWTIKSLHQLILHP